MRQPSRSLPFLFQIVLKKDLANDIAGRVSCVSTNASSSMNVIAAQVSLSDQVQELRKTFVDLPTLRRIFYRLSQVILHKLHCIAAIAVHFDAYFATHHEPPLKVLGG